MLNKKEYFILYRIHIGKTSIDQLRNTYPLSEIKKILKRLEKFKLISLEMKRGKIYGCTQNASGKEIINYQEYSKWFEEFGETNER